MRRVRRVLQQVSDFKVYYRSSIRFRAPPNKHLVDPNIARNCTGISPCQQDTTIIRDAEITANIVNECGRTELTGNIDVGENTENALAAGAVTKVKAGTVMAVTIHQVSTHLLYILSTTNMFRLTQMVLDLTAAIWTRPVSNVNTAPFLATNRI